MKVTTLVSDRRYFGVDAMTLRAASRRILARVVGLPPERARITAQALRQDFGVDTVVGNMLVNELVAEGLLRPNTRQDDFHIQPRLFVEFASARVVEPLPRARAKVLVAKACGLAAKFNASSSHNPLEIEAVAVFGRYMSREPNLAELAVGLVVRPRARGHRARWGRTASISDGADELRSTFGELSTFLRVRVVNDLRALPRPFAVVFEAEP